MKILFVSADRGGCRWYRCLLPARELADQGKHKVLVAGTLYVLANGEIAAPSAGDAQVPETGFDVVVLQRWMNQRGADVIRTARSIGQAVINDVDDWFFGIPTSNKGFERTHKKTDPLENVEHYRKILAASSAITVSTPYLAERLKSLGVPVHVLRNHIDLKRWTPRPVSKASPVVGWLGHTDYRAPGDLAQLSGVLGPWMKRNPTVRFLHCGSEGEENKQHLCRVLGIEPDRVMTRPVMAVDALPQLLHGMDIGLAPLEDCPFNRAKSFIKTLEYGAAGIASVASDMPEYRTFGGALLVSKPKDWGAHLDRLLDPDERLSVAVKARARARELDIEQGWRPWEKVYMNAITNTMAAAIG